MNCLPTVRQIRFAPRLLLACLTLLILPLTPREAGAGPRVPGDDAEVLVRFSASLPRADAAELRRLLRAPTETRHPLATVLPLSRQLILLARAEADPRPLRQAQVLLAPWLQTDEPPVEALLLHATIRQSLHDFGGALAELDQLLRRDPQHGPAWLTRAVIQTVRGDYASARSSALQAMRFADPLAATTVTAALSGALGQAERAHELLARTLAAAGDEPPAPGTEAAAVRAWAWITLGELAERRALPELALTHYDTALALAPDDPLALGARADVLLELGRAAEVISSLVPHTGHDALLLRLAEAHRRLADASPMHARHAQRHTATLRERFAQGRLREGDLHLREEARFALTLLEEPARALELARKNWQTQREWADARLLIEAAEAAGELRVAAEIRAQLRAPGTNALTSATTPGTP
jgi:tetratricopeptide (TPR) repeat protein